MKEYDIQVKAMKEFSENMSKEVAAVFVDGYYKELSFLSKDKGKLIDTYQKMIYPDVFYCTTLNGEVVGILACSDNKNRALK